MPTESDLFNLLKKKFPSPEYALMAHVKDGLQNNKSICDALAMGTWASRGFHLNGFEIKVSRSDFLQEIKNPQKAENIAKFCDKWWMVVSSQDIVKDGELPENWGLLVAKGERLQCKKEAVLNIDKVPISPSFLAAIFRRLTGDIVPREELEEIVQKRVEQEKDYIVKNWEYKYNNLDSQYQSLIQAIKTFEEETGVRFNGFSSKGIAEAYNLLRNGAFTRKKQLFNDLLKQSHNINTMIENVLKGIEEIENAQS